MAEATTTTLGREFLTPDDDWGWFEGGWISRLAIPDQEEAILFAADALGVSRDKLELRIVFFRQESEVEAKIAGSEIQRWTECTTRARSYEPMWRVDVIDA